MNKLWHKTTAHSLFFFLALTTKLVTAAGDGSLIYEDDAIYMRLVIRTKDQLTAFYTGREFPQQAISEILKTCFITPIVRNKKLDTLWVEPDSWMFSLDDKPVERIKRDYWKQVWEKIGLSLAHQSTFGWTLMPETRGLLYDESVGGSIVIPMQTKPFTLKIRFNTGPEKNGRPRILTFQGVLCAN
jgi:hypothetical protein